MPPTTSGRPTLMWFRDDLRLADNPALSAAVARQGPLACLYLLEDQGGPRPPGAAARWYLAGALRGLDQALRQRGGRLILRRGAAREMVPAVLRATGATALYFNRRYEPAAAAVDLKLAQMLENSGYAVASFAGALLHEPGSLLNQSGTPLKVFTPFWRALRGRGEPRLPLPAPGRIDGLAADSDALDDWQLEPHRPDWAGGLRASWQRGEAAAQARLAAFVDGKLAGYAQGRDRPDLDHTSRLSPSLRFGEVSPFQVWHAARMAREAPRGARPSETDLDKFLSELAWREFSYSLLHQHPDLARRNLQPRFDRFPWREDPAALRAWQRGETGYPLVDAGMRELWRTGTMHNRVRMAAASFLIKHLMIDWRAGENWFWDTLVDADPANNPVSWQWVAGCGADAAPFFRVFNPTLQQEKFDPQGDYVRRYVPEWRDGAAGDLFGGRAYPAPIVAHKQARDRALAAFAAIKA